MSTKKHLLISCIIACCMLGFQTSGNSQVVVIEAIATATKKVIRAIDLKIQRLQNKTIDLQNIQKKIENTLAKLKLDEIAEWTRKQKKLYEGYFDELWRVKTAIAYYQKVTGIVQDQKQLIADYKSAFQLFRQDKHFTPSEIEYMYSVYTGIIEASLGNLDQLLLVVKSFSFQMPDAARIEIISRVANETESQVSDLRSFTSENIVVSKQRAKDLADLESIERLYGLKK